ncbi:hypothetical protein [Aeromicrobium sp. CF3.5]|uniref:hypothetical protein n=1 Tax=Aeromicrobium sp. CF3.5 TaxID=3373078 RepID=UPI003EE712AD
MRSVIAGLAGLIAALAVAVVLPVTWLAANIADEDGFVDATTQLASDQEFRAEIIDVVAAGVVDRAEVPELAASGAQDVVRAGAEQVVSADGFVDLFEEVQRASHRATFADGDRIVLDLTPVSTAIIDSIDEGLPFELPAPAELQTSGGEEDVAPVLDFVDRSPDRALLGLGVAAVAAVICVLAARRRSTALLGLGIATAASVWLAGQVVRDQATQLGDSGETLDPIGQRFQLLVQERAVESFDQWVVVAIGCAGVVAVLGLVGRAFSRG